MLGSRLLTGGNLPRVRHQKPLPESLSAPQGASTPFSGLAAGNKPHPPPRGRYALAERTRLNPSYYPLTIAIYKVIDTHALLDYEKGVTHEYGRKHTTY